MIFFKTCWKNELNLDKLGAASCKSQQEKITQQEKIAQDLRLIICDQKCIFFQAHLETSRAAC